MKTEFLIDGAAVAAASGATFERRIPSPARSRASAAAAGLEDVAKVVEAAARAFPAWSETGPGVRRALLNKAADLHRQPQRPVFQPDARRDRRDAAVGRLQRLLCR